MNKIYSRYFHEKLFPIYICIPCHLEIVKKSFTRTCRKLRVSIKIRLRDVCPEEHSELLSSQFEREKIEYLGTAKEYHSFSFLEYTNCALNNALNSLLE